jgi:hypothetical protein
LIAALFFLGACLIGFKCFQKCVHAGASKDHPMHPRTKFKPHVQSTPEASSPALVRNNNTDKSQAGQALLIE